jgi:malonyl-CoA O-methyltransferase
MQPSRKARIARAFDRARQYESEAKIQQAVAAGLAERITSLSIDPLAPALEIGCGTGFLTRALLDSWPALSLTVNDIAPAMLDRTRASIGALPNVTYHTGDGECLEAEPGSYGLIASSLAFQWFEHPATAISRLSVMLRPGGSLAFSTLDAGSFREWRRAQMQAGLAALTRDYPDASSLAEAAPGNCSADVRRYSLKQSFADGLAFLRSLRAIGADARWEPAPSSAALLKRAVRLFEEQGVTISYEIAEIVIRREA